MTSETASMKRPPNAAGDTRAAVGDAAEAAAPAARAEAAPSTGAERIEAAEVTVRLVHLHPDRYSNS